MLIQLGGDDHNSGERQEIIQLGLFYPQKIKRLQARGRHQIQLYLHVCSTLASGRGRNDFRRLIVSNRHEWQSARAQLDGTGKERHPYADPANLETFCHKTASLPEMRGWCHLSVGNRKQTKCSLERKLLKYYGIRQCDQHDSLNKDLVNTYYVPMLCWEVKPQPQI